VRLFGQKLGWATISVEIKNIVVGDLPFDGGRGDFYISVETSSNPPMVTALQEEKLPKLVHFPEIIGLKIRDSDLEPRVRICVKELNVLGSDEICDTYLSAGAIVDWTKEIAQEKKVKRLAMRPCVSTVERETPPWILVEFSEADDVRGVDTIPIPMLQEGPQKVRTWVPVTHETVKMAKMVPLSYQPTGGGGGGTNWRTTSRMNVDLKCTDFKHAYSLLDDSGNPIAEPTEENLTKIRCFRTIAKWIFRLFQLVVYLGIIGYFIFRFYVWSCYRHFEMDTVAILRGSVIPISDANLHTYWNDCQKMFDGTGLSTGNMNGVNPLADACRPNSTTIIHYCQNLPTSPAGVKQPRPEAFTLLAKQYFGIELEKGVKCFDGICKLRNDLAQYDNVAVVVAVVLFLSTFVLRCAMNWCIKSIRKMDQKSQVDQQKRVLDAGRRGRR
jgi:hypothetical protein